MRPMTNVAPLLLLAMLAQARAESTESAVLAQLRRAHPATRFDRVTATPVPGLYEVWMGDNVAYVSQRNLRYLVFGHLFDAHQMRDLTASRATGAVVGKATGGGAPADAKVSNLADLAGLPYSDAIAVTRGSGARRLVVFTDPACGYCRQLDATLRQLDDVTVHYFLLPFQGTQLPQAIWCAQDRGSAYAQVMAGGVPPARSAVACATPLERNAALAARLGVQATPTLLFSDGQRATGVTSREEIEARLAQASSNKDQARRLARSEHAISHQR